MRRLAPDPVPGFIKQRQRLAGRGTHRILGLNLPREQFAAVFRVRGEKLHLLRQQLPAVKHQMADAVQAVVPVFADFGRHIAVPQISGAAARLFAHFFRAPPKGIVAILPPLPARRQHPGKLVLAVPAQLGQLRPVPFLPQLHRRHATRIIILKQVLAEASEPVAFLVNPFPVNLIQAVEATRRVAGTVILIMLAQAVTVTDGGHLPVAVDHITQPLPFVIGRHQIERRIVAIFPIQPGQRWLRDVGHFVRRKKLRVASGALGGQLPHQGMGLPQDKAFIGLAVPLLPVFVPFKPEGMPAAYTEQSEFPHLVGLCLRLPAPAIRGAEGAFCRGTVRIITGDVPVGLHFFDLAILIVIVKRQRGPVGSGHFPQTAEDIVTVGGGAFRGVHRDHPARRIVFIAGHLIQRIAFFNAMAVAVIGIVPPGARIVGFGHDPAVRIQGIAVAFPLRVNHFQQLQAVEVIAVLPAVPLTIHARNR
ncbi:hypothetical protein Xbed_02644 [Xenorhabdus beddingii]|uniref:Uncharacterized protein n=1 Tax=Xenorhabdus beddingii TaxID=40578 RepID=A0A1Y2SMA9_9GAMM|nr:hypothetical protein Xbed_02644 [Xenorhabdus beddingii]